MKNKVLLVFIFILNCFIIHGESFKMIGDTIDCQDTRMYLDVPDISMRMSTLIVDSEGFWVCYPIPQGNNNPGALIVDDSVMNINSLLETQDYDIELWNTFNKNGVGSRCFKKKGLNYRIDRFSDGLEIFYIDITDDNFDLVNQIIKSVYRSPRKDSDPPLNKDKRKIIRQ